MSAYADKIAMEVIEADALAGARGLVHPPLDWHKAVALARAVFSKPRPEVAALNLLDEAIQELGKHYAPEDVITTKDGMAGWNGAVGYCIGTLRRMQDDRQSAALERSSEEKK